MENSQNPCIIVRAAWGKTRVAAHFGTLKFIDNAASVALHHRGLTSIFWLHAGSSLTSFGTETSANANLSQSSAVGSTFTTDARSLKTQLSQGKGWWCQSDSWSFWLRRWMVCHSVLFNCEIYSFSGLPQHALAVMNLSFLCCLFTFPAMLQEGRLGSF